MPNCRSRSFTSGRGSPVNAGPVRPIPRYHHSQFADPEKLLACKCGRRISVCIPALDEEATIGRIVSTIRNELVERIPLVDEILVIDSGSGDRTLEIAAAAGANAMLAASIAPQAGPARGKGENLWKALHVAEGDIICYIDGDISNFSIRFVTGLVGPLLVSDGVSYVKAYYRRPLAEGAALQPNGGGRVSEILIRPLLSMFYPELSHILQPLSGEYAARREVLEALPFPTGYGVEVAHLIDLARAGLLGQLAQTDLDERIHRNRDEAGLGRMAFAILHTLMRRLERDGKLTLANALPTLHRAWDWSGTEPLPVETLIDEVERPPLARAISPAP
jgi:glucosyl-3-phosphoglycerate synthase